MLRSMYASVSSMLTLQARQGVITNNLSNINTTGYKGQTVVAKSFDEMLLHNKDSYENGVSNVKDLGSLSFGVRIDDTFTSYNQGSLVSTDNNTDFAIVGSGFFQVSDDANNTYYTRDGSFSLDMDGHLVTAEGYKVLGENDAPIKIPKDMVVNGVTKKVVSFNIAQDGSISYLLDDGTKMPEKDAQGNIVAGTQQTLQISVFQNDEGLEQLGGNIYGETANSGQPIANPVFGKVTQGAIEMSNVDLSEEFTEMIVTTRAFQAASKVITTSDELLQEIVNLKR